MSTADYLASFQSIGLVVEHVAFGALQRVPVDSDKGAKKSGWYVLHEYRAKNGDRLVYGHAGNWKTGASVEITPDGKGLDDADRKALDAQREASREQAEAERQARAAEAKQRAERIWPNLPEQGRSEYLERKSVGAYGIRFARGAIVVPVRRDKALVGLQWISADGSKKFLSGTPKRGACHRIGSLTGDSPVLIAEGYATAASLHQATGYPVLVVFDAGNIEPVTAYLREHVRGRTVVICADDDHETKPQGRQTADEANAGQYKARAAAQAHKAFVVSPSFVDPAGRSDFNDMHVEQGLQALRQHVLDEIRRLTDDAEWREQLIRTRSGTVQATLHNIVTIMEHDNRLAGLLRLDEFSTNVVFSREPPFGGGMREISDAEVAELAAWFGSPETYGISVSTGMMYEAVGLVGARNKFHPVRDYLDSLVWDGHERIPTLFREYFGVPLDDYTRQVALNWLISAVARVRNPGCKCDLMTILEGEQGAGKSTAIKVLCGTDWFVATTESPDNKDFYQILQGRWIVEIEEMQAFSKPQMPKIKSAISVEVDVFRPSYGRMPRSFPRHNVFVGTTNDDEYLRDPTGARRFMPVRVGGVDIDLLKDDRDQLWAEADIRYKRGEPFWDLPAQADAEREARYMDDSWTDPIAAWLEGQGQFNETRPAAFAGARDEATTDEILTEALGLDKSRHTRQEQMRVGTIMRRLGWQKKQVRRHGRPARVYVRPEDADQRREVVDGF